MNSVEDIILAFDERQLKDDLSTLDWQRRAIFAAACAQRLFPHIAIYEEQANLDKSSWVFSRTLEKLWKSAASSFEDTQELRSLHERCVESLPDDDAAWKAGTAFADDASAAIVYALEAVLNKSVEASLYSARRVYEAIDACLGIEYHEQRKRPTEAELVSDPRVQRELVRQRRDIRELKEAKALTREMTAAFRARAVKEAESVFE